MVNIEQTEELLKISYVNTEGQIELMNIDIPKREVYEWKYCEPNDKPHKVFKSWDNKDVKKVKSKNLNKYRITEFLNKLPKEQQDILFQLNVPKMYFCDIEVEVLDEFPDIENPKAKILTISIVNENERVIVLGLKDLSPEEHTHIQESMIDYFKKFNKNIKFQYIKFDEETTMLHTFLYKYVRNMSLVTGWNFIDFDWKYIVARSRKLGIDPSISSISNQLYSDNDIPLHKIIIDYMDIYKRWDTTVEIKESHGLDYVSNAVLGLQKIKYEGSLNDLYQSKYKIYVFYNAVDSFLVRLLHQQLNTLTPFLTLSHVARVETLKAYGTVHLVETVMAIELLKQNKVFVRPGLRKNDEEDKGKYAGAYVMQPKPGLHSFLATFDYSSLYPTNIRQWNISPDVYLGKNIDVPDSITTSSGAVFKKNEDGVLRVILSKIFDDRKKAKKTKMMIEQEINKLTKILKTN